MTAVARSGGAPNPPSPRDRPLDGLRGLAIFLVVLYHATVLRAPPSLGPKFLLTLPGMGWSGVDLFFVLSGFLITRILVRERTAENYFRAFYARRVLRIFPVYYAFLIFTLVVLPRFDAVAPTLWLRGAEPETFWYWVFLGNFRAGLTGQFHHALIMATWSLAIEEHFYLVWPWVVSRLSTRVLERVCAAVIIGSFVLRTAAIAWGAEWIALYTLTPFRLDGLAAGAWVALRSHRDGGFSVLARPARLLLPTAGFALVAIVVAIAANPHVLGTRKIYTLLGHPLMRTAGYSVLALFYASLLTRLMAAAPGARLRRAFETRALVELGRLSFALYLFHIPVILLVHRLPLGLSGGRGLVERIPEQLLTWVAVFAIGALLSELSWRVLEAPALSLRRYVPYRRPNAAIPAAGPDRVAGSSFDRTSA